MSNILNSFNIFTARKMTEGYDKRRNKTGVNRHSLISDIGRSPMALRNRRQNRVDGTELVKRRFICAMGYMRLRSNRLYIAIYC